MNNIYVIISYVFLNKVQSQVRCSIFMSICLFSGPRYPSLQKSKVDQIYIRFHVSEASLKTNERKRKLPCT